MIGTDPHVDRRLSAVAEVEIPFYAGLKVGVPSLPAVVEALAEGRYDVLHLCSPGPGGRRGRADRPRARAADRRLLPHRADRLHGAAHRRRARSAAASRSRSAPSTAAATSVLSPSEVVRRAAARAGHRERIGRWDRGVDVDRFSPRTAHPRGRRPRPRALRRPADEGEGRRPAGRRLPRRAGARPAAGARARRRRARGGARCARGSAAPRTFLGWLEGDALARAYADADLFLFCSQTDTFGQVVLEAQASGLPVVAVDAGGPSELIDSGRTRRALPGRAPARSPTPSPASPPRPSARAAPRPRRPRRRPRTHLGGLARRPRRRLAPRPRRPRGGAARSARHDPRRRRRSPSGRPAAETHPAPPRYVRRPACCRIGADPGTLRPASPRRGGSPAAAGRDVALFYGERSGGIRTYLDAKAAYARAHRARSSTGCVRARRRSATWRGRRARCRRCASRLQRLPLAARHAAAGRPAARARARRRAAARPVLGAARGGRGPRRSARGS